jgi:hypothetical protein
MRVRTIRDILARIPRSTLPRLAAPAYFSEGKDRPRIGLAVESMQRHISDELWQIFLGLDFAGYHLCGHGISPLSLSNDPYIGVEVASILDRFNPSVVVVQDRREYMGLTADKRRDPEMRFRGVELLRSRSDIFKISIVRDAHHSPSFQYQAAEEIGCHAWICYYAPAVVCKLAPYLRPQNLIRVYHTVDPKLVPVYCPFARNGCVISGAVNNAYPLRRRLVKHQQMLPHTTVLPHPGYYRTGCHTPAYLQTLSTFKVAVCTSSMFGYALRKLIEATAAGCRVITDLPADEVLPEIDSNLVRVHPDISIPDMAEVVSREISEYDPARQKHLSDLAVSYYDYKAAGVRLAADIESMRRRYSVSLTNRTVRRASR